MAKKVKSHAFFQLRIVLENSDEIPRHRKYRCILPGSSCQLTHPAHISIIGTESRLFETLLDIFSLFGAYYASCCFIFPCQLHHCDIRRQFVRRGTFRCIRVKRSELVKPNQIKSITELSAGRVCRMVRISELVIVHNKPGACAAFRVRVPPLHCAGGVFITKERLYSVFDRVCPAERADKPRLSQRVSLLFCR